MYMYIQCTGTCMFFCHGMWKRSEGERKRNGLSLHVIFLLLFLGEVKYLQFPNGVTLSLVYQQGVYYILNTELQSILPQANQNIVAPLRSLLSIPLEYASRYVYMHVHVHVHVYYY